MAQARHEYRGLAARWIAVCTLIVSGCSRSDLPRYLDGGPGEDSSRERCNVRDDDDDGKVDEAFRDDQGRYVDPKHGGKCDEACVPQSEREQAVTCEVVSDVPRCVATRCS